MTKLLKHSNLYTTNRPVSPKHFEEDLKNYFTHFRNVKYLNLELRYPRSGKYTILICYNWSFRDLNLDLGPSAILAQIEDKVVRVNKDFPLPELAKEVKKFCWRVNRNYKEMTLNVDDYNHLYTHSTIAYVPNWTIEKSLTTAPNEPASIRQQQLTSSGTHHTIAFSISEEIEF